MVISSKPLSPIPKNFDIFSLSSACASISFLWSSPYSPVTPLRSSILVDISAKDFTSFIPSLLAVLPNTLFITSPTCIEFSGSSFIFAEIFWTAWRMLVFPEIRSCSSCLLEIPILSSALCVDVDIVLIRLVAVCIRAIPCSLNRPERVWVIEATRSDTEAPASLKAGANCLIWLKNVPLTSAPAWIPSLILLIASWTVIPYWFIRVSTDPNTSLYSLPIWEARAEIWLRTLVSSSPEILRNSRVRRWASSISVL